MTDEETRDWLVPEFTAVARLMHGKPATGVWREWLLLVVRQVVRAGADEALLSIDFEFQTDPDGTVHWWPLTSDRAVYALWKRIFTEPLTVTSDEL